MIDLLDANGIDYYYPLFPEKKLENVYNYKTGLLEDRVINSGDIVIPAKQDFSV